jgi:hypothetical protein
MCLWMKRGVKKGQRRLKEEFGCWQRATLGAVVSEGEGVGLEKEESAATKRATARKTRARRGALCSATNAG